MESTSLSRVPRSDDDFLAGCGIWRTPLIKNFKKLLPIAAPFCQDLVEDLPWILTQEPEKVVVMTGPQVWGRKRQRTEAMTLRVLFSSQAYQSEGFAGGAGEQGGTDTDIV